MFHHSNQHPQSYEFHWKWSNASPGHQIAQSTAERICQTRLWYIITIHHSLTSIFCMQWLQKLFKYCKLLLSYTCVQCRDRKKTVKYNPQTWILLCCLMGIKYLADIIYFSPHNVPFGFQMILVFWKHWVRKHIHYVRTKPSSYRFFECLRQIPVVQGHIRCDTCGSIVPENYHVTSGIYNPQNQAPTLFL